MISFDSLDGTGEGDRKLEGLFPDRDIETAFAREGVPPAFQCARVGFFPAAVLILGISQEIQVKILWTRIKKKKNNKKKPETSGEKDEARLYPWVEVKGKARGLVAKTQAEGLDGLCYHESSGRASTWDDRQVTPSATHSEKR